MDIRIYFYIQPILLKGLNIDSLNIHEIFLDVKTENGVMGKYKNFKHKTGTHFKMQLWTQFISKIAQYRTQKVNCVLSYLNLKMIEK